MKKNIAIIVLSGIAFLLLSVLSIVVLYEYYYRKNTDQVLLLPNETQKNNSFNMWETYSIYEQMSLLGFDNFNLDKSDFSGGRLLTPTPDEIIPGVYYLPEEYFSVDVDFTTGETTVQSNLDYVPKNSDIQYFLAYVDAYSSSNLKEFPGYKIKTCAEVYGESLYPGCYGEFEAADTSLDVEYFSHYDAIQIIQTALNPEHKAIQLYIDTDVIVPNDSIYYQKLYDLEVLIVEDKSNYAILNFPTGVEITNAYDEKFIEDLSEILPQDFVMARYTNLGNYDYTSFEIEGTHFKLKYGSYDYDELQEYIGDDTIMQPIENDNEEKAICAYNDSTNANAGNCYSEVQTYYE